MATWIGDMENQTVRGTSLCLTGAASTNALLGSPVDMLLAEGPLQALLTTGDITGTSVVLNCKLQESAASTGTFTDVVGGAFTQAFNQTTGDNVCEFLTTPYRTMRHVRAHVSVTGTITTVPISIAIFGQKNVLGGSGTQL